MYNHIPDLEIRGEMRRHLFYTVKEALHNIIKHAQATEAELNLAVKDQLLSVEIIDNGKGFPNGELNRFGNGMENMRSRMESIHGNISIENHQGTKISLKVQV